MPGQALQPFCYVFSIRPVVELQLFMNDGTGNSPDRLYLDSG
jgi:hypothetical protein